MTKVSYTGKCPAQGDIEYTVYREYYDTSSLQSYSGKEGLYDCTYRGLGKCHEDYCPIFKINLE